MWSSSYTGGLTHHQFGFDGNFGHERGALLNLIYHGARGDLSHAQERLAHRGESRTGESRCWNIVESDDRYVFWNAQAGVAHGADGANGGDVVIGKERGERDLSRQHDLRELVAELRRGIHLIHLHL